MTNKEQLTQEVKRLNRAFNSYNEKELKAFYNTIKGMVKKAYNRLEEVQKGNVKTKRYQYLSGSESPAKKALEKQGGLLKDWKDVNPFKSTENNKMKEIQREFNRASKFLNARTSTLKDWADYHKEMLNTFEEKYARKLTLNESYKFWDLVDTLRESTELYGAYNIMHNFNLSSDDLHQNLSDIFDSNKTIDDMLENIKDTVFLLNEKGTNSKSDFERILKIKKNGKIREFRRKIESFAFETEEEEEKARDEILKQFF